MTTTLGAIQYSIFSDGAEVNWELVEAVFDEALGEIPTGALDVLIDDVIAAPIEKVVRFELARCDNGQVVGEVRKWEGMVVRAEVLGRTVNGRYRMRIHLAHKGFRLGLGRRCQIVKDVSAADVCAKLLREAGLQADVSSTSFTYEFLTQYFETDLEWLQRVADSEGLVPRWSPDAYGKVEVHRPGTKDGTSVGEFTLPSPEERSTVGVEHVHAFVQDLRVTPKMINVKGWKPATKESEEQVAQVPDVARQATPGADMLSGIAGSTYSTNLQGAARPLITTDVAAKALHRGEGSVIAFTAGRSFQLNDESGTERSGKYTLTRVQHRLSLTTDEGSSVAAVYENAFECVLAPFPARPPSPPRPRALAPVVAIVTAIPTTKVKQLHACEVAVKFPVWGSSTPQDVWLRLAQPFAGPTHGMLFLPHVNDEVLVHFIDGDPDKPVVLGALYNGKDLPPSKLPDMHSRNVIRSVPYGKSGEPDELYFEENTDRRIVGINAANDHVVAVKRDVEVTVDRNRTETVKGNEKVTVQGTMTTEVTKERTTTVKANEKATFEANSEVTVKGNAKETVFGSFKASADGGFVFQCGDTKLEITPAGITMSNSSGAKIDINGPMITIENGGGAKIVLAGPAINLN